MRTPTTYGILAITTLTALAAAILIWSSPLSPNPASSHGSVDVLTCDLPAASGGDNARLRGFVFMVDGPFDAIEMRMYSQTAGVVAFDAVLRRSSGFTTAPEATSPVTIALLSDSDPPFTTVHMDFPQVSVSGMETFTLAFTNVTSPGDDGVFYEVQSGSPELCTNVTATNENDIAEPTLRNNEPFIKVLGIPATPSPTPSPSPTPVPTNALWGDNDCNDAVDAVDALKNLQHVAGLPFTQNDPCFDFESTVDVTPAGSDERAWGDADCDQDVDSVDALSILRWIAAFTVNQEQPCPEIGSPVLAI